MRKRQRHTGGVGTDTPRPPHHTTPLHTQRLRVLERRRRATSAADRHRELDLVNQAMNLKYIKGAAKACPGGYGGRGLRVWTLGRVELRVQGSR